ncbi:hypothetical protein C0993_008216 [Termitomyces sp. T159_Od127]|nr:hypothetical protein C0993_008216 [Termitomyces sp. T159_Od127]
MSTDDNTISITELHDYDAAARFLFKSCPASFKDDPELGLNSPESFACLLYRNLDLFESIQNAKTPRKLNDLWQRCAKLARPLQIDPLLSEPEKIPLILDRIAPKMLDLVSGNEDTPLWTLDQNFSNSMSDTRKLDLKSLLEEERLPSMLFYELGSFENNLCLNERVGKLFHSGHNTFLVNASATGKTRLLFEGLCQHWGLYITAHSDAGEARALQLTLSGRLYREGNLVKYLPRSSSLGFEAILAENREIVFRRFSAVLLAHLYVFRAFLMAACKQVNIEDKVYKRRWLLAQLHSPLLDIEDPHEQLLRAFEWESLAFIDKQLELVLTDIKGLLPESVIREGLFITIDEANVAIREIWFSEHRDTGPYPALEEIIRVWRVRLALLEVPITFVVAGTHIPREYFPSASQDWSSWKWTSDTGGFDDQGTQKQYLLPFLPPSFSESARGQALFGRIWDWCRPRHRFTTSYIVILLEDKLKHPHGILDQWIENLTGFIVSDAKEHIAEEGPCTAFPFLSYIGALVKGKDLLVLVWTDYPLVRSTTHEVIMTYIITGKHPACFDISKIDIVSSGVGEFKDKDMSEISLDQPGPTIAAAVWLSKASHSGEEPRSLTSFENFCSYFQGKWPNGDTYASASYVALYLAYLLNDGSESLLSHIFTVPSAPAWLMMDRRTFTRLVILQKDEHDIIREMVVTASALLPEAPPLGYAASTPSDVVAWLQHKRHGAFCLCPPSCKADLIFVLRHRRDYVWVLLRISGQGSTTPLNADELYSEFEQLSVENLFLNDDVRSSSSIQARYNRQIALQSETLRESTLNAFKALPNSPPGRLSLLRVVATFPSEPTLHRKRIKGPPVAVLNTATFKAVTESIPREVLLKTLVLSMHGKRSFEYADNAFSPIGSSPLKERTTKRKALATSADTSPQKNVLGYEDSVSASDLEMASGVDSPAKHVPDRSLTPWKRAKKSLRSRVAKS